MTLRWLVRLLDRLAEAILRSPDPARWKDDLDLDAAVARHPAGKMIRPARIVAIDPEER